MYWNEQWQERGISQPSNFVAQTVLELARMHPVKDIVEVGGGLNTLLPMLRAFLPEVGYLSYDISQVAQDENLKRFDWGAWYTVDVTQGLEWEEDGSADFVFSSHLIEHLEDPWQLLEEQLRICKKGGIMAVAGPLHMWHREHRQVLTVDMVVGMMNDYARPVFTYLNGQNSEIVAAIIKA